MTDPAEKCCTWSEQTFLSAGTACAARVYRPTEVTGSVPVVVMAHGFGSVRALRLYAYAERFAAAGYAVVVFDYRGFGDSDGAPRQLLDVGMQHADWRAALAFARSLSGVDADRVVAWGTSFAGGHVITLAGQHEPLAAIIAQVPHVSGLAAVRATGLRPSLRVGVVGVRDQVSAWFGRGPVYVNTVAAPGQTGVMTSPDAVSGLRRLIQDSGAAEGDYPTTVAARIALKIGFYSPQRLVRNVSCPALVQIVENDAITPQHVAEAAATAMQNAVVRIYPGGHFDPYVEPLFSKVIADQIDFLHRAVPLKPAH